MTARTRAPAVILLAASSAAALFSFLLLRSEKIGIASYAIGLGIGMLLLEPFAGLINYLALLYLRPQEFVKGLEGVQVMLIVGGATCAIMLIHFVFIRRTLPLSRAPQNVLMVLLAGAIVLSHLSHVYLHGALDSARAFASTFVMYLLIVILVRSEAKLKITLCVLSVLTLFHACQGIYQYFNETGLAGQTMIDGRIRSIGIFADPNDLALTFLIVMPFLFFSVLDSRSVPVKLLSGAVLLVLAYALYLTGSRGGFIALAAVAFLLFVRRFGIRAGSVVGIAIVAVLFAFGPERLADLSPQEESAYGRIAAWGRGLELLKQNPLFGVGAGTFMEYHVRTAHNSIVLCASELGLFGLYVWLLLIVVSMRNLFFVSTEARRMHMVSIALLSDSLLFAFVGFITAAFFLSRTYNELLYILVGLGVSATAVFAGMTGEKYSLFEKKDLVYTGFILVGSLFTVYIITRLYW
ncbi:MAG: O-antigen ligase family protein [Chitinivibrionia bacterium]|nr:O-antigen ligase family protein [Chitinivibrionia bacterium]